MKKLILLVFVILSSTNLIFSQACTAKDCYMLARDYARNYWRSDANVCNIGGHDYNGSGLSVLWTFWCYSPGSTNWFYNQVGFVNGMAKFNGAQQVSPFPDYAWETIPLSIIDSDQAMYIAEQAGGRNIRASYNNTYALMFCYRVTRSQLTTERVWDIYYYVNDNPVLRIIIDAEDGELLYTIEL